MLRSGLKALEVIVANVQVHDLEAQYYDTIHTEIFNRYEQRRFIHDIRVIRQCLNRSRFSVLDIGCGTGNLTTKFLRLGCRVDAVDASEQMLARLRRKAEGHREFNAVCSDADTFLATTPNTYDVVCFGSILHHLPDYISSLDLAAARLAPGGVLYIAHEPLPRSERTQTTPGHEILSWVGDRLRSAFLRVRLRALPKIDYSRSDVHADDGISPEGLETSLRRFGLSTVMIHRYRCEVWAVTAWISNNLLPARPRQFTMVVRKAVRA